MILKKLCTRCILLVAFFCPAVLYAADITLFYTKNQSPLITIYGLPSIGEAAVMAPGKGAMRLTVDMANNYTTEQKGREAILLDGESSRFTIHGRYGVGSRLEVGVEVPYVIIGGGFLDSVIEGYHHTFGFPNGGRDQAPQNQLVYQYVKDGRCAWTWFNQGPVWATSV